MATSGSGIGQFNFTLKQNADTSITMTWLDDNGNPTNLTEYAMALTIRAFVTSPVALLTINSTAPTANGSVIELGGTAGTITLIFTHGDTALLTPNGLPSSSSSLTGLPVSNLGVYDLQYTSPSGDIDYLLEGNVLLDPRVT